MYLVLRILQIMTSLEHAQVRLDHHSKQLLALIYRPLVNWLQSHMLLIVIVHVSWNPVDRLASHGVCTLRIVIRFIIRMYLYYPIHGMTGEYLKTLHPPLLNPCRRLCNLCRSYTNPLISQAKKSPSVKNVQVSFCHILWWLLQIINFFLVVFLAQYNLNTLWKFEDCTA